MHRQTDQQNRSVAPKIGTARFRTTVLLAMLLLLGSWSLTASAVCRRGSGVGPPSRVIFKPLPASITLKPAAMGGVMATVDVGTTNSAVAYFDCEKNDRWGMEALTITLPLQDASSQIYETGVKGIGIRFRFATDTGNWTMPIVLPFQYISSGPEIPIPVVNLMRVEFIRTGMEVGRGSMMPFDFQTEYYMPTNPMTHIPVSGTQLRTTLVQNFYYTSCYNAAPTPTVNLGRPSISEVKKGDTLQKDFSLDIRCDGLNPATKPPVKIYFEGNAPRDGLLLTDGQGVAGKAQGVAVALTDANGVALPFAKARALTTTWTASGQESEFYRFQGKARYVASGGEIKAGQADATLTYVLQYN